MGPALCLLCRLQVPVQAAHGDICAHCPPGPEPGVPVTPAREQARASLSSVPLPPALASRGEAYTMSGKPHHQQRQNQAHFETCHSSSFKWFFRSQGCACTGLTEPVTVLSLCPCDHRAATELGERDLVCAGEPSLGGGKERGESKGRQSQQTDAAEGEQSGPVLRMSCVEWPRSPTPLRTFQVLWVADGWLPATHVLQSPIQPPHLVPPKMIKLFLTIFLTRENISR